MYTLGVIRIGIIILMKTLFIALSLMSTVYANTINVHCSGEDIRNKDTFELVGSLEDLTSDQLRGGFTIEVNGELTKEEIVEAQGELKGVRFRNLINSDTIKIAFKNNNSTFKTITIRPRNRRFSTIKYRDGGTLYSRCETISE